MWEVAASVRRIGDGLAIGNNGGCCGNGGARVLFHVERKYCGGWSRTGVMLGEEGCVGSLVLGVREGAKHRVTGYGPKDGRDLR